MTLARAFWSRNCDPRVTTIKSADAELFACRHCYAVTYASQREALPLRDLGKAQKIRMRLGGSQESQELPQKPKGMHWRTYDRLCRLHDAAEERSTIGLMHFVGRLRRVLKP
jgi:hypothetical protein